MYKRITNEQIDNFYKHKPKNIIEKILIGKVFKFNPGLKTMFVILAVKYNPFHNRINVLIGGIAGNEIVVYSWYQYYRHNFSFLNRSPKHQIKKCLRTNPDKIKYHAGKTIDISKFVISDNTIDVFTEYLTETNKYS